MEFDNDAQKACYERIRPMVKELWGEFFTERTDAPVFGVIIGSAIVEVGVRPWRDDEALVHAWSWVVRGAELTPDLLRFLLKTNTEVIFGAFGVDDDGDIVFSDTIVASTCDKPELKHLVNAVMVTADKFDDQIVSRWGGLRAADRKTG